MRWLGLWGRRQGVADVEPSVAPQRLARNEDRETFTRWAIESGVVNNVTERHVQCAFAEWCEIENVRFNAEFLSVCEAPFDVEFYKGWARGLSLGELPAEEVGDLMRWYAWVIARCDGPTAKQIEQAGWKIKPALPAKIAAKRFIEDLRDTNGPASYTSEQLHDEYLAHCARINHKPAAEAFMRKAMLEQAGVTRMLSTVYVDGQRQRPTLWVIGPEPVMEALAA